MKLTIYKSLLYFFVFLFAYSATSKIINFDFLYSKLKLSPLLDESFVKPFIIFLISLELSTAISLFMRRLRVFGTWITGFLMINYTAYLVYLLFIASYIPCSCGGVFGFLGYKGHIVLNLIILSGIALFVKNKNFLKTIKI
jgi:hypothetical protein